MHQMNHQFKIGVNDSVDHTSYYKTQFFKKNNNEVSAEILKYFFQIFSTLLHTNY